MADRFPKMVDGEVAIPVKTPSFSSSLSTASTLRADDDSLYKISSSVLYAAVSVQKYEKVIRLLDLQKSVQFDAPLVGSLRTASLEHGQRPRFAALSYVWGSYASPRDIITCGSCEIEITSNCRDALRQIRANHPGGCTLWVDTICINQTDDEEKSHQVLLMKEIYTWADRVYVWLGTGNDAMWRAMRSLSLASRASICPIDKPYMVPRPNTARTRKWKDWLSTAIFVLSILPPFIYVKISIARYAVNAVNRSWDVRDFEAFFSHEWFHRVWTYQEALLASEVTILCGSKSLKWSKFLRGFWFLRQRCANDRLSTTVREKPFYDRYGMYHGEGTLTEPRAHPFIFLEGLCFLWLGFTRPASRLRSIPDGETTPETLSFFDDQKRYVSIKKYLLPENMFSRFYLGLVFGMIWSPIYVFLVIDWTFMNLCIIVFVAGVAGGYLFNAEKFYRAYAWHGSVDETGGAVAQGIVQVVRDRKASDAKDRSYALYGILELLRVPVQDLDYRKSAERIHHELCRDLLSWRPSTIILLLDGGRLPHGLEASSNPSWVPRWEFTASRSILSESYWSNIPQAPSGATPGLAASARFDSPEVLSVRGHWKGEVSFCCAPFRKMNADDKDLNQKLPEVVLMFWEWIVAVFRAEQLPVLKTWWLESPGAERSFSIATRSQALQVPLSLDSVWVFVLFVLKQTNSTGDKAEDTGLIKPACDFFAQWAAVNRWTTSAQDALALTQALLDNPIALHSFLYIVGLLAQSDMRPLVTSDGYIGCGSKNVAVGDRLALIAGVPAPMALRPKSPESLKWFDTEYEVVCSTFVLGWMDGSAFSPGAVKDIKLV